MGRTEVVKHCYTNVLTHYMKGRTCHLAWGKGRGRELDGGKGSNKKKKRKRKKLSAKPLRNSARKMTKLSRN